MNDRDRALLAYDSALQGEEKRLRCELRAEKAGSKTVVHDVARRQVKDLVREIGLSTPEIIEVMRRLYQQAHTKDLTLAQLSCLVSDLQMGRTELEEIKVRRSIEALEAGPQPPSLTRMELQFGQMSTAYEVISLRRAVIKRGWRSGEHPSKATQQPENKQQTNHSQEGA